MIYLAQLTTTQGSSQPLNEDNIELTSHVASNTYKKEAAHNFMHRRKVVKIIK